MALRWRPHLPQGMAAQEAQEAAQAFLGPWIPPSERPRACSHCSSPVLDPKGILWLREWPVLWYQELLCWLVGLLVPSLSCRLCCSSCRCWKPISCGGIVVENVVSGTGSVAVPFMKTGSSLRKAPGALPSGLCVPETCVLAQVHIVDLFGASLVTSGTAMVL